MKIQISVNCDGGTLTVTRENGDKKAKASGFTRAQHGWGAEIHLLGMIAKALNKIGFHLTRTKVGKDGHMMGDDHMTYLRPPLGGLRKNGNAFPLIYIIDGDYAVRSSAEDYNNGKPVTFQIHGNVFFNYYQPNWWKVIQEICQTNGIECKVDEFLLPPKFEVVDVIVDHIEETDSWDIGSYGRTSVDSTDDPVKLFNDEADDRPEAINTAMHHAWMNLVSRNNASRVVVLVNGNEHSIYTVDYNSDNQRVLRNSEHQVVSASELQEGDMLDLESCPYTKNNPMAEFEYCYINYVKHESETCVAVGIEGVDEVGYDPNQCLRIKRRDLVFAETPAFNTQ